MEEIAVAIFAICIGGTFCFFGCKLMRILFPLWGLVAGYWFGAELVHAITGDSFFSTTIAIVTGIIFALLGALFAYLYYSVAVILFMGLVGFWFGAGFITLIGFNPGIISTIVGICVGLLFIVGAFFGDAPKVFLLFITSWAGAALTVGGVLLLINVAELSDFERGAFQVAADNGWFWKLVVLALGLAGLATQLVSTQNEALRWEQEWAKATASADAGTKEVA